MRRSRGSSRVLRPVALDLSAAPPSDDLSTWGATQTIATAALPSNDIVPDDPLDPTIPGEDGGIFPLLVDVTNIIDPAARADVGGLRFRSSSGVLFGHYRTATNRILLGGNFSSGINTFTVFWDKAGATQPGDGFPTAAQVVFPYRLALLFENNAPVDISPDPVSWTVTGTPTFNNIGLLGDAMQCAEGSYIQTTAAKLRGNARDHRSAFVLFSATTAGATCRVISWANWLENQRAFQLFVTSEMEIYASDNGTGFQRWRYAYPANAGWNTIGGAWRANQQQALYLLNGNVGTVSAGFSGESVGELFNSTTPYIIGGTQIPGALHDGQINAVFELKTPFVSPNHLLAWDMAWGRNDVFWGAADRTPDNFDVPEQTNVGLATEVTFPRKEITSISPGTAVSVSGQGNPTYSIGSSFSTPSDIKAKGSTPGTIDSGQWLATFHTSAATNSTLTESTATVGTVSSPRRSTTVAADGNGGDGNPEGPYTVQVNSLSALVTAFNNAKNGDVIEIVAGDYKSQGGLSFSNKDFRGGAKVWIRASQRPYRGMLPAEGGLLVQGETFFVSGSGGFEVPSLRLTNVHNIGIEGLRLYQNKAGLATYASDIVSCTNIDFQYTKWCGYKPTTPETDWGPVYKNPNQWMEVGRGPQMGIGGTCDRITFRKSMFHFFGLIGLFFASCKNGLVEDCVFTDQRSDHLRSDGPQDNLIVRRCIFYRCWGQQPVSGGGLDHADNHQNTAITQPGHIYHTHDMCIYSPGDCVYPHIQGPFYTHNKYPEYPRGYGLTIKDCLYEGRAFNSIRIDPCDRATITRVMILQQQYGGRTNMRDLTYHTNTIVLNARGNSFGNNKIERSLYWGMDKAGGDQVTESNIMPPSDYPTHLNNYPVYNSSQWHQVKCLNPYTGVIDVNEMRKWSPKTSSPYHPNNKGFHFGASAVLAQFGALL
jgi:hypothetical protein